MRAFPFVYELPTTSRLGDEIRQLRLVAVELVEGAASALLTGTLPTGLLLAAARAAVQLAVSAERGERHVVKAYVLAAHEARGGPPSRAQMEAARRLILAEAKEGSR